MRAGSGEVLEIVEVQLGRVGARPADRLIEDLGAESADLLNLVVALEDRYGIAIGEQELGELVTVGDVLTTVAKLRAARAR